MNLENTIRSRSMVATQLTQEIKESFVYETLDGTWFVVDPTEFDQVIPGGPWKTKEAAEAALEKFVIDNSITFE